MGGAALRPVVVLGATGSIGRQTLEVADRLGIPVVGLAAGGPSAALSAIARRYPDATVAVADGDGPAADEDLARRMQVGPEAVAELAGTAAVTVVNAVVGAAGLLPSLAALEAGNRLALANKESLVAGGAILTAALARHGGELVPIDSEHSAIWQCIVGERPRDVRRLVLTASGGPFRGRRREDLASVEVGDALAHPTWRMGPRITIDSATLMNKAFEVIEAHHLFGIGFDDIDVVVHPQSYVHSLVEFVDGVVKAEVGPPDMRKPIQYALTAPDRRPAPAPPLDLAGRTLTFERPDPEVFRCLEMGYVAGRRGGSAPAVLNAADEVAVAAFLAGRIGFLDIPDVVAAALEAVPWREPATVAEVLAADTAGREAAAELVARLARRR